MLRPGGKPVAVYVSGSASASLAEMASDTVSPAALV